MSTTSVEGVTLQGELGPDAERVLTPDALALLADLHRTFNPERERLLRRRLERQDAIAKAVAGRERKITAGVDELTALYGRRPEVERAIGAVNETRAAYVAAIRGALKRSRQETVVEAEERDGSRDQYLENVVPAQERTLKAAEGLAAAVDATVAQRKAQTLADGAAARRLLLVVTLVVLLLSAVIAFVITRSVTRPLSVVIERLAMLRDRCVTDLGNGLRAQAGGDFTVAVTPVAPLIEDGSRDEVGRLADTDDELRNRTVASVGE